MRRSGDVGRDKRETMRERVRYGLLVLTLAIGAFFVYMPGGAAEKNKAAIDLSEFPMKLGDWNGTDLPISDSAVAILDASGYLMREYECGGRKVTLYITYFNSGNGALTHNPEKCYTGSGWTFLDKKTLDLPGTDRRVLQSTVVKGDGRQLLVYWYQDRDRVIVSKWNHVGTVISGAMFGRGTHSLVASVAEVISNEDDADSAEVRLDFAEQVMEALGELMPQNGENGVGTDAV